MLFWKLFIQSAVFIFVVVIIGEGLSGLARKKKGKIRGEK